MTATLEYNLEDKSDDLAFTRAIKSNDLALVLFKILNRRKNLEELHSDDESYLEGIATTYKELCCLLEEHEIDIDELVE
jgi:hypothetical protein